MRFICNDYSRGSSITEMLQTLSLPTLNQCRDTAKTVFMYKILHQIVDVSVPDCYLSPISCNTQGHPSRFIQLQTNIDVYKILILSISSKILECSPESCDQS